MSFTHADVQNIIQLLDASHFDELVLEMDGIKLELRRGGSSAPAPASARTETVATSNPPMTSGSTAVSADKNTTATAPSSTADQTGLQVIRAPMLGTFYSAPKPGAAPFVSVGDRVEPDTVVGIIEVMKLMNSASAGVSGEVVEILVSDGELVEYDQPLMRVKT